MCFKIFCLLVLSLNIAQTAAAAAFRAAVAKVDITPATSQWLLGYDARQSDGIHDRLYHRIVALDDGKTTIFIVSSHITTRWLKTCSKNLEYRHRTFGGQ
jgi:neutral ceramidase